MAAVSIESGLADKRVVSESVKSNARVQTDILVLDIVIPFLLGFLGCAKIRLIGSLAANEVLLLLLAPYYATRAMRIARIREYRLLLAIGTLYLLSLMVSDFVRSTATEDYLRGWTRVLITLISLIWLPAITSYGRYATGLLVFGYGMSPLGSLALYGVTTEFYKFYLGMPISVACFLIYGNAPKVIRPVAMLLPLAAGTVALWQNSRSLAAITLLSLAISVVPMTRSLSETAPFLSLRQLKRWFARLSLLAIGGLSVYIFYGFAAPRGWLGERAQLKHEAQIQERESGNLGMLAGREELFYTWPKIAASPVLGHGSWAKDYDYVQQRSKELGVPLHQPERDIEAGVIPAHSHIFGAWLEAGFLGAAFWLAALWLSSVVLLGGLAKLEGPVAPTMIFFIVMFIWDLFFSPYGAERRIWNGFLLGWLCWVKLRYRLRASGSFQNATH
jgi:hypothetical protein